MADLPELPGSTKRKLALQWSTLLHTHGLTGEHLQWHQREWERLDRVAAICGGSLHRDESAADSTGTHSTVALAEARFKDLSGEYWRLWLYSGDGYEGFVGWLNILRRQVSTEVASVWVSGSKALDRWYKRACGPAVETTLTDLVKEGTQRARAEELKRLERGETHTLPSKPRAETPAPEGGFPRAHQAGATEPSGDELSRTEASPAAAGTYSGGTKRLRATVSSKVAATRMEAYMESNGMGQTEFAGKVGTTDRTLRAFRKTGMVRRDIFDAIAKAMGTTREALLNAE